MRLAVPAFLLITVLVQLQLVHRKFMEITKSVMKNLEAVLNEDHQTAEDLQSALVAMFRFNSTLQERRTAFGRIKNQVADKSPPLFRIIYCKFICFMDIHWYRIVCIITASVTTTEISAMGFVLLFITLLSLFFLGKPQALRVVILINQFILGVFILAKMLFQLKTIPKGLLMANCTALDSNKTYSALTNTTMDAAGWLGLRTLKDGEYLSYYIGGYIGLLVSLTMVAAFRYQQTHHRYQHPDDLPGVVFQNSNHENLDSSFVNLVKYLVDFFFYRFGVECCMFVSAIVISTRLDVFGAIYSILLLVTLLLTMMNRRFVKRFWPLYFSLLSIVLGYQYLCALGLPPALCLSYPWEDASLNLHGSEKLQSLLKLWLYFPSYSPSRSPDGSLLIGDFIQLLVVAVQWQVFLIESESSRQGQGQPSPRSTASPDEVSAAAQISEADLMPGHRPNRYRRRADWYVEYASRAGNNAGLYGKLPANWELETTMSRRDFTRDQLENWSEFLLGAVCRYWIWASVVAIFVAGTQNINLYTLVYLTFCFYLLWHGVELLKKRHENIIRLWNVILIYNCLVILVKTCLQVLSCVFLEYLLSEASSSSTDNRCIPAEMFSLKCLNPRLASDSDESESRFANCGVSVMEAGITWDIVCFFWLIIQRRIFHSSFYQILVCSYRAQFLLAAAGGKMMKKIRDAEIKKLQQQETDEVENITQRMVKIREGMEKLEKRSRRDWTHDEVIRGATASMLRRYLEDDPTYAGSQERFDTPSLPPTPPTLQAAGAGTNQLLNMFPDRRETGDGDAHPSDPDQATKDRDEADSDAGHSHPPPPQPGISILDEEIGWVKRRILFITKILRQKSRDFTIVSQRLKEIQIPVKKRVMELMLQGLAESHQYADDEQIREILYENESDLTNRETIQKLMDKHEEMMKEENEHKALWKILLAALSDSIISKTDLICYAAMVLCYLEYGSLMSLVLPILAVMWGMLSLPRPAKIFWITVLTYTMGMILVKSFFQLKVFPWSPTTINKWYDWRLILGISNEKINRCSVDDMHCKVEEDYTYYVFFELFLLLWVCFHRSLLRTYGLWRDEKFRIDDMERVDEPLDRESCDLKHSHDAMSGQPAAADDSSGSERTSGRGSPVGVSKKNGTLSRNPKRMGSQLFNDWWKALNTGSMFPKGDYYAWMFLCDFINFLITVVAYNNFGPQYGNVQDYIQESRIPVPFLILLLVQFILLFIDRAIYLKKSRVGRLVFHIFLVVVVHIWMFLVLPIYTNLAFVENNGAKAWYFFKCVYFGLSAWQIKSGYPSQVSGNFLTSQYGIINWILLKAFLLVPFLLEIRVVMDWMLTKTSLSLPSWFTMEDIFAKMFLIKCLREYEKNNPSERGDKARRPVVKYTIGILLIVALVLVIWFPLLLFSIGYQVYLPNPPVECEATVSIGGFQDVFKTRTQPSQINQVTADQLSKFREANIKSATATGFLDTYGNTDITTIQLDGSSLAVWGIAPPNEAALLKSLNSSDFTMVTTKLLFTRLSKQGLTASSLSASYRYELKVNSTQRKKLYEMLASKISQKPIELPSFLPRYIRLPNTGLPQTVSALQCFPVCTQTRLDVGGMPRHGMTLQLQKSAQNVTRNESRNLLGQAEWWNVGETSNYTQTFNTRKTNKQSYTGLFFVTFSDKIAPDSFKFLAGPGIIGLYVTLVFAVGRILRPIFSDQTYTLMFEQLPYVDRVFKMCEDIYIVRGSRDLVQLQNSESCLKLEEDLFALLIFLFRSPEILIQYTDLKAKEKTD